MDRMRWQRMPVTLFFGVRRGRTFACHQKEEKESVYINTQILRHVIHDKEKMGEGEEIKIHHHDGLALDRPRRPWHRLCRSAQQRRV
jgi:hypothetical protein